MTLPRFLLAATRERGPVGRRRDGHRRAVPPRGGGRAGVDRPQRRAGRQRAAGPARCLRRVEGVAALAPRALRRGPDDRRRRARGRSEGGPPRRWWSTSAARSRTSRARTCAGALLVELDEGGRRTRSRATAPSSSTASARTRPRRSGPRRSCSRTATAMCVRSPAGSMRGWRRAIRSTRRCSRSARRRERGAAHAGFATISQKTSTSAAKAGMPRIVQVRR